MSARGRAVIWSRADRAARMFVEYATTETLQRTHGASAGPAALESIRLHVPHGPDRSAAQVSGSSIACCSRICPICAAWSEPAVGSFTTPPATTPTRRDRRVVGRHRRAGLGHQPGLGRPAAVRDHAAGAAGCLHQPWRHDLRRSAASRPKSTLDDGTHLEERRDRGQVEGRADASTISAACHQYNLIDEHMRRFIAEVPQIVMWDDHEVRDNWYRERRQDDDARYDDEVASRCWPRAARQAFFEYNPLPLVGDDPSASIASIPLGPLVDVFALDMRSYRGREQPEPADDARRVVGAHGSGAAGVAEERPRASRATWKIIASDLPIGLVVPRRRDGLRSGRQRRSRRRRSVASSRWPTCSGILKRSRVRKRRLDHGRRPLLRGASLRSGARDVHRLRSVLGVRRRPAERRDVRSEPARRDVRAGGEVHRHPAGHETESSAERRIPVLRHPDGRRAHRTLTVELLNVAGQSLYKVELAPL